MRLPWNEKKMSDWFLKSFQTINAIVKWSTWKSSSWHFTPTENSICLQFEIIMFYWLVARVWKKIAMAGNRTRVNCLEGSYANHYTTDACWNILWYSEILNSIFDILKFAFDFWNGKIRHDPCILIWTLHWLYML